MICALILEVAPCPSMTPFPDYKWTIQLTGPTYEVCRLGDGMCGTGTLPGILTGTSADNTIVGSNLNEFFYGEAGNDLIQVMGGDNVVTGGAGNDIVEL